MSKEMSKTSISRALIYKLGRYYVSHPRMGFFHVMLKEREDLRCHHFRLEYTKRGRYQLYTGRNASQREF